MKKIVCLALALCLMLFTADAMAAKPTVSGGTEGTDWEYVSSKLEIKQGGEYTVSSWKDPNGMISIAGSVDKSVKLTVDGVEIKGIEGFGYTLDSDESVTINVINSTISSDLNGILMDNHDCDLIVNVTAGSEISGGYCGISASCYGSGSASVNVTDSTVYGTVYGIISAGFGTGSGSVNLAGATLISGNNICVIDADVLMVTDAALYASEDDSKLLGVFKGLSKNLIDLTHGLRYLRTVPVEPGAEDLPGAASLPGTGDPSMLGAWVCLLSAAGAGMAIRRKK